MQDTKTLSNFLAAAGKKFQTHPSDIAQEIYPSLVSDLIPRQSPVAFCHDLPRTPSEKIEKYKIRRNPDIHKKAIDLLTI